MEKCLLLGNGGREAVIAENIAKTYSLYSVLPYENPSIVEYVEKSNGKYAIMQASWIFMLSPSAAIHRTCWILSLPGK